MKKVTVMNGPVVVFPSLILKIHTVGNLTVPQGVIQDPKSGTLYVVNYGANIVLKYSMYAGWCAVIKFLPS